MRNNVLTVFTKFSKTFWVANTMELFERWAFYGFYMLFANYLTMSTDVGALGLSQTEKGIIMGVGTFVLYLLPVITGAIADRIGFKIALFISYLLYFSAFLIMPFCKTFIAVFLNYLFLAIAAALFKPIISATIAQTTNEETSSLGFGIYYMMVNIGAFIGPLVALQFSDSAFHKVFYISGGLIVFNGLVLLFYNEPEHIASTEKLGATIIRIIKNIRIALSDKKMVVFLFIVSGFWIMYYQLFFTLSVFISQWVDITVLSNKICESFPLLIKLLGGTDGTLKAEHITNMDALFIIVFQLLVSSVIMKWRPVNSMITGFIISSIGMGLTLMTNNVFFIITAIFVFGIGEMAGSPKITEYNGRIAPKDKVGLYMGCSFLPVALGSLLAGQVSGPVYQHLSDKTTLLKREFIERGLNITDLSQNELILKACNDFNMTASQLTAFLWDKYHPSTIWLVVTGIGLTSAMTLFLYDKFLLKEK